MVRRIAQTPDGYLWIAAFGGISRFDGARILHFEVEPPMDLAGLAPGDQGQLFVAPRRGPMVCAQGGALVPCKPAPTDLPVQRPQPRLRARPGRHVVGGHRRRAPRDQRAAAGHGPAGPGEPAARAVRRRWRSCAGTPAGSCGWARTTACGSRAGPVPPSSPAAAGPLRGRIRDIVEGAGGTMWVLTDDGLRRIDDGRDWAHPLPRGVTLTEQSTALEDRDGNVWIGAQNGLVRFRDGRFDLYTKAEGLPDDDVTAVFEDREGSLWVGTRAGSIAQFTDRTVSSKYGPPGVAGESIESVSEDPTGRHVVRHAPGPAPLEGRRRAGDHPRRRAAGRPGLRHLPGHARARSGSAPAGGLVVLEGRPHPGAVRSGRRARCSRCTSTARGCCGWAPTTACCGWRTGRLQRVPVRGDFQPAAGARHPGGSRGTLWVTSVGGLGRVIDGQLTRGHHRRRHLQGRPGHLARPAGHVVVRRRHQPDPPARRQVPGVHRRRGAAPRLAVPGDRRRPRLPVVRHQPHHLPGQPARPGGGRPGQAPARGGDHLRHHRHPARDRRPPLAHAGRLEVARRAAVVRHPARGDHRRAAAGAHQQAAAPGADRAGAGRRPPGRCPGRPNEFPPGPRNIELHYAGVTLLEPRKIQQRYRLEGFDADWIDAGTRRVAYYTNIPRGPVPLPGAGQQRRRRLERGRGDAGPAAVAALLPDALVLRPGGADRRRRWGSRCTGRGCTACAGSTWRCSPSAAGWRASCTIRCCRACRRCRWSWRTSAPSCPPTPATPPAAWRRWRTP